MKHKTFTASILAALLLLQSCGASDFASQLRVILAAAPALVESLNLSEKKAEVIQDFADIAQASGHLADDLKTCGPDKACKLQVISVFEVRFWDIERRGHFKLSPKLQNIENLLAAVISAAKVYYGNVRPSTTASDSPVPAANPEKVLSDRLAALKEAMRTP